MRAQRSASDVTTGRQRIGVNRCCVALLLALALGWSAGPTPAAEVGRTTGLPLPRFVSVKARIANVRVGPGTDYPVQWQFVRRGLPVEIIAEFGNWRRIRDWEGQRGWVLGALLSGRRTGLVAPWSNARPVRLREEPAENAAIVAIVQPMVLVQIDGCDGEWCAVRVRGRRGYLRQTRLWGAYPGEKF